MNSRLVDVETPMEIKLTVLDMLNIGAGLLLPQLRERMELLHSLLPEAKLTCGQKMLLDIILNSLEDHSHVAALLSYSAVPESLNIKDIHLTELLMTTLLQNLNFYTVSYLHLLNKRIIYTKN